MLMRIKLLTFIKLAGNTTRLPGHVFAKYANITGATRDRTTGFYTVSATQYSKMQSLVFTIKGRKFNLTRDAVNIYSIASHMH